MERTPAINLPAVVFWLALAFIGVHVARQLAGQSIDDWVVLAFAFVPERYAEGGAMLPGGEGALFWSPVSYSFLHADYLHLFVNIIWMLAFGTALARRFTALRFLLLSVISAVGGAAFFYVFHRHDQSIAIGASAAVSGMMGGIARFAFSPGGPIASNRSPDAFHVPAEPLSELTRNGRVVAFVLLWFVINFIFGVSGGLIAGISGSIAWEAHVGGFLAGLFVFPFLDPVGQIPSEPPAQQD